MAHAFTHRAIFARLGHFFDDDSQQLLGLRVTQPHGRRRGRKPLLLGLRKLGRAGQSLFQGRNLPLFLQQLTPEFVACCSAAGGILHCPLHFLRMIVGGLPTASGDLRLPRNRSPPPYQNRRCVSNP